MIIAKHDENGKTVGARFHSNGKKMPKGFFSLGNNPDTAAPIDRVPPPEELQKFDDPGYKIKHDLAAQRGKILSLIKENEYHFINGRHEKDRAEWERVFTIWYEQLETVKGGTLVKIESRPVFS